MIRGTLVATSTARLVKKQCAQSIECGMCPVRIEAVLEGVPLHLLAFGAVESTDLTGVSELSVLRLRCTVSPLLHMDWSLN